jgi:hypothetical protein
VVDDFSLVESLNLSHIIVYLHSWILSFQSLEESFEALRVSLALQEVDLLVVPVVSQVAILKLEGRSAGIGRHL